MALQNNIYQFNNLSRFSSLFHAITTKKLPSVRKGDSAIDYDSIKSICNKLNISNRHLLLMDQIHGSQIIVASKTDGILLKETDGMIIREKKLYGGIVTADCLPIIIYDSKVHVLALIHAGYKGLLAKILPTIIIKLQELGCTFDNLYAGIGPGIGACCYNVPLERAEQFNTLLPNHKFLFVIIGDKTYLDLKKIVYLQLTDMGILKNNIEVAQYCTRCDNDLFFSYRAEGPDFGEFLTVGGLL